jgi:hypothetical protein
MGPDLHGYEELSRIFRASISRARRLGSSLVGRVGPRRVTGLTPGLPAPVRVGYSEGSFRLTRQLLPTTVSINRKAWVLGFLGSCARPARALDLLNSAKISYVLAR